jgi:aspartyl-tRNA(Asn)/glutamyl-tRNA(Gln) amidotransferase subunit C
VSEKKEIISLRDVQHIATLARLELNDAQLSQARDQLAAILKYMEELNAVDVSKVPPAVDAFVMQVPLREDARGICLQREEFLQQAPASAAGGVLVPRVLEVEE